VVEDVTRTFADYWTGTGAIDAASDLETIELDDGEYMESEVVDTESYTIRLRANVYRPGDDPVIQYRTGATEGACLAAGWTSYTVPFSSLGFSQVRIENT